MKPNKPPNKGVIGKLIHQQQMPALEIGHDLSEDQISVLAQHLCRLDPKKRSRILKKLDEKTKRKLVHLFAITTKSSSVGIEFGHKALRIILQLDTIPSRERALLSLNTHARFAVLKVLAEMS